jgi:hypothetical protein
MAECGLCKKSFTEGRNYPMEAIALASKFQCQYKPEGCTEIILGEKFTEHVKTCRFRHLRKPTTPSGPGNDSLHFSLSYDEEDGHWSHASGYSYDESDLESEIGDHALAPHHFSMDDTDERLPTHASFQTTVWVRHRHGSYPENAVIGGTSPSGETMYVIRAYHGQTAVSGHLCPSDRAAYIIWGGSAHRKWYYDVLVAFPGTVNWINYWREAGNSPLIFPEGVIKAKEGTRYPYIVARARQPDGRYVCGTIPPYGCYQNRGPQGCYYKNLLTEYEAAYADRRLQILVHVETD